MMSASASSQRSTGSPQRDARRQLPHVRSACTTGSAGSGAGSPASSSATLSIVPAVSTAICAPPSSSLVTFLPNARSTTGGPAAKIWLVPFTMTDQCDRIARPDGPPAVGAHHRADHRHDAQQLDRALEAVLAVAGNDGVAAASRRSRRVPPTPSIRLTSGMRYSQARSSMKPPCPPLRRSLPKPVPALDRVVLAADRDRPAVDLADAHDVGRRLERRQLAPLLS